MTTITPYLLYKEVDAALDFLSLAFGFEEVLRYTGAEGYVNHAEMRLGDAAIYLGDPGERYRNPKDLGQETVGLNVAIDDDVDALCERARAAGAEIKEEPADQAYGAGGFKPAPYHYEKYPVYLSGEAAALKQEMGWIYQSQDGNIDEGMKKTFAELPREEVHYRIVDWQEHEGWNE